MINCYFKFIFYYFIKYFIGPRWLPIIGCIPLIQELLDIFGFHHLVWQHFSLNYGPVTGFRIGRDKLIVIAGKDAIKEFYGRDEFNGRPDGFFFRVRSFGHRLGVVFTDGKDWEIQRRFSMKTLKQLSNNRLGIVAHVQKEAEEMIEFFRNKAENQCLIEMHNIFDVPVLNVMWALLAGYRFHADDERLLMLMKMIHESFRVIDMSGGILNQFPFIRHIFPEKSGYRKLIRTLQPLWKFLLETVEEIREQRKIKNYDENEFNSLIEAFLLEIEKKSDNSSTTFTSEQLLSLCLDFFQAGSETTSNSLGFGIIYMLHNPHILEKMRNEMDTAIGRHRLPCLADRPNLPYTEAVINEIQRYANVAPLAIAHRVTETTKFYGYVIPKNTIALVSLYSLNMDTNYWKDPNIFRPERFLNNDGRLIQYDAFIPFGLGYLYLRNQFS